jgi:hypothetical protein
LPIVKCDNTVRTSINGIQPCPQILTEGLDTVDINDYFVVPREVLSKADGPLFYLITHVFKTTNKRIM